MEDQEFVIALHEDGWNPGSVQFYHQQHDSISAQALSMLKTRAKDDRRKDKRGKTNWIHQNEGVNENFKWKHILKIRPS